MNKKESEFPIEINKIHQMHCLEGLKLIPDKSVDLAFIDPPYNVGKDYGVSKDNLSNEEYEDMIKKVISEFRRITKKGFAIYIDWKQFQRYWSFIPDSEPIFIFKRSSGVIFSPLKIVQHHHVILTTAQCLSKKCKSVWDDIRVMGEGYFFREEKFDHPAQTALKATKRFIEHFSNEGDLVLDCFMGVGTTAVASKELNRKYIGFELNPEYIKRAEKRLTQSNLNTVKNKLLTEIEK
jgi:site-specific DNA-methyltransferase (adenine-specific)